MTLICQECNAYFTSTTVFHTEGKFALLALFELLALVEDEVLPGLAHVQTYPSWHAVTRHSSLKTRAVRRSCDIFLLTRGSMTGTSWMRGH